MKNTVFILLVAAIVYTSNIWGTSIYILDEAKNASCAMEMMQRKNFIIPVFNNVLRTDKPPLHYYFMMMSYNLFGFTPFAARIFSALAGISLILLVYVKVKRHLNATAAFYSVIILLSSIQLTIQFHMAVPDPYLILWMTLSLFSLYEILQGDRRAFYFFYIGIGLGFLTKGLIAIVFPALIALTYLVLTRSFTWYTIKKLRLLSGFMLFCIIALPWYIAVGWETQGEWLRGFFLDHNVNRYTATMEGHRGFLFSPFLFLFLSLFPYSAFSFYAFRSTWRNRTDNPFIFFCSLSVIVIATFFSFSKTMLPGYVGPAIPFLAIVLGNYIREFARNPVGKLIPWLLTIILVISVALPIAAYVGLNHDIQSKVLANLSWLLLIIPFGSLLGLFFYRKGDLDKMILSWFGSWVLLSLVFFYIIYPALDKLNPVIDSRYARSRYTDHKLVSYGIFNAAFVWEYKHVIPGISIDPQSGELEQQNDDKFMIITRSRYLEDIQRSGKFRIIYRNRDLFEKSETVILVN